jgi:hypothetical protein
VRYLSTASAAQAVDMSRSFIAREIKDGNLPAIDIAPAGSPRPRYRITEEALAAFIERRYGRTYEPQRESA